MKIGFIGAWVAMANDPSVRHLIGARPRGRSLSSSRGAGGVGGGSSPDSGSGRQRRIQAGGCGVRCGDPFRHELGGCRRDALKGKSNWSAAYSSTGRNAPHGRGRKPDI